MWAIISGTLTAGVCLGTTLVLLKVSASGPAIARPLLTNRFWRQNHKPNFFAKLRNGSGWRLWRRHWRNGWRHWC